MKQKIIILGAVVIIIIIAVILINRPSGDTDDVVRNQEVTTGEPLDIALDFYTAWLAARKAEGSSPYAQNLHTVPYLSEVLRDRITSAEGQNTEDIDPVLCQTTLPEKVTARIASETEDTFRVLIMARDKSLTAQSVFVVRAHKDGWYVADIECAPGEFAPEREFSVERSGYLIKNVPPPLDANNWHIVFEENGELGHFAPLFFDGESLCKSGADGDESVCTPDQFTEATKVFIRGQMIETGVEVRRLEFVE